MHVRTRVKSALLDNPRLVSAALGIVRRFGVDIVGGTNPPFALLEHFSIDRILDVGANEGQYARRMRALGYRGALVSFEPVAASFSILAGRSARDPRWAAVRAALGERDGETVMHVSEMSVYSSILQRSERLELRHPGSVATREETVPMRRLDSVFSQYVRPDDRVLLKIDTQGYERAVLEGAADSLSNVTGVQLELSFEPLYEGETSASRMLEYLAARGFTLMSLEPLSDNLRAGELLQGDGLFFRR